MTWEAWSMQNKVDKLKTKFKTYGFQNVPVENEEISHRVESNICKVVIKGLYPECTSEVFNP